jgi:hypothetical protein
VLENGVVIGRIFLSPGAPQDRQWMWASGHDGQIARAAHGYEGHTRGGDGGVRQELATPIAARRVNDATVRQAKL